MKAGDIISKVFELEECEPVMVKARVNWVSKGEAGITNLSPSTWKGLGSIINIEKDGWIVSNEIIRSKK